MARSARTPTTPLGQILEQEGRKQSWLCERTGIDPAYMSRFVHGSQHVPDDKQKLIADALGREISDLFPKAAA